MSLFGLSYFLFKGPNVRLMLLITLTVTIGNTLDLIVFKKDKRRDDQRVIPLTVNRFLTLGIIPSLGL